MSYWRLGTEEITFNGKFNEVQTDNVMVEVPWMHAVITWPMGEFLICSFSSAFQGFHIMSSGWRCDITRTLGEKPLCGRHIGRPAFCVPRILFASACRCKYQRWLRSVYPSPLPWENPGSFRSGLIMAQTSHGDWAAKPLACQQRCSASVYKHLVWHNEDWHAGGRGTWAFCSISDLNKNVTLDVTANYVK